MPNITTVRERVFYMWVFFAAISIILYALSAVTRSDGMIDVEFATLGVAKMVSIYLPIIVLFRYFWFHESKSTSTTTVTQSQVKASYLITIFFNSILLTLSVIVTQSVNEIVFSTRNTRKSLTENMEVFKKIFSAFFRLGFRVFRVEKKVLAICLQFEIVIYLYDYDHNGSDFILEEMKANTAEKSFNNIVMFFAQSFGTLAAAPVMFLLGGTNRPTTSLSPPIGGDSTSTTNNSHPSFSSKV